MKRKPHSTSLVLLLLCIFTFWWGISVLAQHDASLPSTVAVVSQPSQPAQTTAVPVLVSETIKNGTHTYTGSFNPQHACDSFGSGIHYSSNDGGHVSVLLITSPALTDCAQAAGTSSTQTFSVSIKLNASEQPQFDGVLLNGATIPSVLASNN